jgi:hypothetical protein
MFYNLFLPGGIGGDGYKVYLLQKHYGQKVKALVSATFLDRISGLVALCFLAGIGYSLVPEYLPMWWLWLVILLTVVVYPAYYMVLKRLFRDFILSFHVTNFLSLGVQIAQVIAAYFILSALGVDQKFGEYIVLFLLSSVVAVLPFTIGGVGARELTFIIGADYFLINQNTAVAFSLIFFLITLLISAVGGFLPHKQGSIPKSESQST